MATLEQLKQQYDSLQAERLALDSEIGELVTEWRELVQFLDKAGRSTSTEDITAAQRDRDAVARQANELQAQRNDIALRENKASIVYHQALSNVEAARKTIRTTKEPNAAKMAKVQERDIVAIRSKANAVLQEYGVKA